MEDLFDNGFETFHAGRNYVNGGKTPSNEAVIHHYCAKSNQYHMQFSQEYSREMKRKGLTNVNVIRNRYTGELTLVFNKDGEGAKFSNKNSADITNSKVVRYIMRNYGLDPDAEVHQRILTGRNKALEDSYMAFTIGRLERP